MSCRIAILGDSSSADLGAGTACYPLQLFEMLRTGTGVELGNHSTPGFTSSDASRYFHDVLDGQPLDWLILYLGNNEGAIGVAKGYYQPFKTRVREALSPARQDGFSLALGAPPNRFVRTIKPPTVCNTPRDFQRNLRAIIKRARRNGTRVILVNPIANDAFPCGLGAPNSAYFCYLDDYDRLGYAPELLPVDDASTTLTQGLKAYSDRDYPGAARLFGSVPAGAGVAGFIARHNLACARANAGDPSAADILSGLIGKYTVYDSTVLYNLSRLHGMAGDTPRAEQLRKDAIERDISLYRVQKAYRNVVSGFAGDADLHVLDLKHILNPSHFIDYCHPTFEGHRAIAQGLYEILTEPGRNSSGGASYRRHLPSPNFVTAKGESLIEYYGIEFPFEDGAIKELFEGAAGEEPSTGAAPAIPKDLRENFLRKNHGHPVFDASLLGGDFYLPKRNEITTFPEFYIHRILSAYVRELEEGHVLDGLRCADRLKKRMLSSDGHEKIILARRRARGRVSPDFSKDYLQRLEQRIDALLRQPEPLYRVSIGDRIRAVIGWYTREAFRYGTQSRLSMLYPRLALDHVLEGLVVLVVVAAMNGDDATVNTADALLSLLLDLYDIHETNAADFHYRNAVFSVERYAAELDEARRSIGSFLAAREHGAARPEHG